MAVPKRRASHARSHKRRAHQAMKEPPVVYCSKCGAATLPHRICPKCDLFHDRTVEPREVT